MLTRLVLLASLLSDRYSSLQSIQIWFFFLLFQYKQGAYVCCRHCPSAPVPISLGYWFRVTEEACHVPLWHLHQPHLNATKNTATVLLQTLTGYPCTKKDLGRNSWKESMDLLLLTRFLSFFHHWGKKLAIFSPSCKKGGGCAFNRASKMPNMI